MSRTRLAILIAIIAVLVVLLIALRDSTWGAVASGVFGGLGVSGIFAWPFNRRQPTASDLLEPIGIMPREGDWSVRLDAYQGATVVTVLSRSLGLDRVDAFLLLKDLPREVLTNATQEHAHELVRRLEKVGATATAL